MSADPEEIWPRFYFTAGYGNFIKELRLHNWRNVISRSLLRHQLMPGSPSATRKLGISRMQIIWQRALNSSGRDAVFNVSKEMFRICFHECILRWESRVLFGWTITVQGDISATCAISKTLLLLDQQGLRDPTRCLRFLQILYCASRS